MKAYKKLLSQEFANAFCNRLNSDLVDLSDRADCISSGGMVAADLMRQGTKAQETIKPLTYALEHWSPEIVDEFSDASDGAWSFDADTESLLKDIVREMIAAARYREGYEAALKPGVDESPTTDV